MEEKFSAVAGQKPKSSLPLGRRVWRFARWPVWIVLGLYVALVIYRIPHVGRIEKGKETIAYIRSHPITMNDVDGNHLPPPPDPALADATVAGIDANANDIRDDVELAIFALHPDSARIRAAELQYAKALQWQLTRVINEDTFVATVQEISRGFFCIGDSIPKPAPTASDEEWNKHYGVTDKFLEEVETLTLNTSSRENTREDAYEFMKSHGDREGPECDIDPQTLTD